MKRFIINIVCLLGVTASLGPKANAEEDASMRARMDITPRSSRPLMASFTRISVLGGADVSGSASRDVQPGFDGAVLLDLGRGRFSFETGIQGFTKSALISSTDGAGSALEQAVNLQYVGVPLLAKYNYIEKPLNAFSLKAGALAAYLMNQDSGFFADSQQNGNPAVTLNRQTVFAVAGFTGSSGITESLAFVLDATYTYQLSDADSVGTRTQGLYMGAGLMFAL